MAISSIGVGSGLPLDALLSDLRKTENRPLSLIESRAASTHKKLGAYDSIKGAVQSLRSAAQALAAPATFGALAVNSQSNAVTAKASTAAIAGKYAISIQQLATHQTLASTGQADREARLANGSVSITFAFATGEPKTITLSQSETSLDGIVKAINGYTGAGLNATLINDGSNSPHRLLLTTADSGTDNEVQSITIAAVDTNTDATALQTLLAFEKGSAGNLAETAAQQARLDINGIQLESSSNTLHNAIEGVTLTLSSTTGTGEPHMLTLARDDAAAHAAIRSFVGAYNNLQGVIKSLTAYNADKQQGGPLTGDGLARRLPERLRQALHTSVNGATTLTLPELGITSKPDGTLAIDDTRLDKAIKDNLPQVKSLLTGENGFGSRISSIADLYLEPGGELERVNATMTTTLKALDKQFEAVSARIDAKMETYRKQFVQLDAMVAQMNSLSNYLTQQLSMLERSAKQK